MTHPDAQPAIQGPRVMLVSAIDNWVFQELTPALRRTCSHVCAYPLGESMGNWHIPNWPRVRKKLLDRLLADVRDMVKGPGLDLVLTVQYDDTITPDAVRWLRDLGVRVVTYHVDMNAQWYRALKHGPLLDLLAVSHMQYVEPFIRRGANLHFMPMAASLDRHGVNHQSDDESLHQPGVLMLGSANNSRARAVAACTTVTNQVDVWGGGWDRLTGRDDGGTASKKVSVNRTNPQPFAKRLHDTAYIAPRLMAEGRRFFRRFLERSVALDNETRERATAANFHGRAPDHAVGPLMHHARIVLGINQREGELGTPGGFADSRLRDFEAPMAGGFYLVQSFVDLPLFYRVGEEVESFSSLDELARKVSYYLDHEQQRVQIARAGRARALRDHTWDERFKSLFHRLDLPVRNLPDPAALSVPVNFAGKPWCSTSPGCEPDGQAAPDSELDKVVESCA